MNSDIYSSLSDEMREVYDKYCLNDNLSGLKISNVILSEMNKDLLSEFLKENKYKMDFIKYDLQPINRLLFYGDSGTGKTYLTKCMAAELEYTLLAIDIANALSTGNAPIAIEQVFKLANDIGRCIIFLDECDAIARDRTSNKLNEDANVRRANNALFQQLDRMDTECIFISATNLYDELDKAFVRRFNMKFKFEKPRIADVSSTIRKFLHKDFSIMEDADENIKQILNDYGRKYLSLSYDAIRVWVERSMKNAIVEGRDYISEKDIYGYLMEAMRIKVGRDKEGKPYLYQ